MPRGLRNACASFAAVLFVVMIVLLVRGPRFQTSGYSEPVVKVECGSILTVGWPSDGSFVSQEDFSVWNDRIVSGSDSLPDGAREGFARDCSERRDTYLGFMVVLSVPATMLGAVALVSRRQRYAPESPAID